MPYYNQQKLYNQRLNATKIFLSLIVLFFLSSKLTAANLQYCDGDIEYYPPMLFEKFGNQFWTNEVRNGRYYHAEVVVPDRFIAEKRLLSFKGWVEGSCFSNFYDLFYAQGGWDVVAYDGLGNREDFKTFEYPPKIIRYIPTKSRPFVTKNLMAQETNKLTQSLRNMDSQLEQSLNSHLGSMADKHQLEQDYDAMKSLFQQIKAASQEANTEVLALNEQLESIKESISAKLAEFDRYLAPFEGGPL